MKIQNGWYHCALWIWDEVFMGGTYQNFVEKILMGGSQTTKFVNSKFSSSNKVSCYNNISYGR